MSHVLCEAYGGEPRQWAAAAAGGAGPPRTDAEGLTDGDAMRPAEGGRRGPRP